MSRKYTGFDGYASGKRKGTEQFIREFIKLTGGAFFNNGSYGRRAMRGVANKPSIHGTGRACDLSYRGAPYEGCGDRKVAEKWINWLVEHAEDLQLEIVVDYMGRKGRDPFGRGWKCDRNKWKTYLRPTVTGGGKYWADWIHVEVSPDVADDADFFKIVFAELAGKETNPPKRQIVPFRGKAIRRGEKDRELVKKIQRVVGAKVDGYFGAQTEKAVMKFQAKHGLTVDGWIGQQTWQVMGAML
jgi:peptidoglycan hydrolase-like protein with peptidoglycan-binding domain